jgi:hypothetical protein
MTEPALSTLGRAFADEFGVQEPRRYGTDHAAHQGFSDNAAGAQWNTGVDRTRAVWTLGVNLEGMAYDGWPIARFLERELRSPELPALARSMAGADHVEVWLEREAWQASARPAILESRIGPPGPLALRRLDETVWESMVREAYDCMDPARGHRGRARQMVTLVRAGRAEKQVAPHLQFKIVLRPPDRHAASGWEAELKRGRAVLQPIYDFLRSRSQP